MKTPKLSLYNILINYFFKRFAESCKSNHVLRVRMMREVQHSIDMALKVMEKNPYEVSQETVMLNVLYKGGSFTGITTSTVLIGKTFDPESITFS